ncbi:MAG: ATP-binding protein, partial [Campylobacterota bacterium]|nr:ATP-binding protein [Campylobacterota bacterium]
KINKTLSKTIKQKKLLKYKHILKFVKIDSGYYYISLLPIKNIENKNIGYIISYEICDCVDGVIKEYYIKLFISFLLFSLLLLFVYINHKSNIKLKEINKISNEQRDKAIKATKTKSEFLANMSHEIRTPLNAILGFIEILKDEIKDEKFQNHLKIIDDSSKNLLKIIEDILDFSKIESGKLDIDKVDFNSKAEFEVITHLFSARCLEKNIYLNLNIDKNLPQIINTDPFRIKQVITNLMSNAIKFTDNGKSITIDIRYINSLLFISIKDEGIGIDENKYIDIFKAFTQEDTSTTRQYGGTGLGLSISNELIKLLGGELKVNMMLY